MLVIEVQEGALLQGRAGQSGGGGSGSTPPGWTAVAVSAFSAAAAQLAGNRGIGNVTSQPGRSASGRRHQPPGPALSTRRRAILGRTDAQRRALT